MSFVTFKTALEEWARATYADQEPIIQVTHVAPHVAEVHVAAASRRSTFQIPARLVVFTDEDAIDRAKAIVAWFLDAS